MEDSPPEFVIFRKPAPPGPSVYELALDLVGHVHKLLDSAEHTRFNLKDSLDRNTMAIAMILAHVLEEPPSHRWHKYRSAHGLASTCQTILDIIDRQGPATEHLANARRTIAALRATLAPLAHRG
jgi:hypothetical protein